MNIGELAHLTGLTITALRHYDEKGVLVPAHVDASTRYRSYTAGQVRDALVVQALRGAGVGLPAIRAALADGSSVEAVLDEHRAGRDAERAAQDAAEAAARALAAALRVTPHVTRRNAPAQPYAGIVLPLDSLGDADSEEATEACNAAFSELWHALAAAGSAPVGAFWTVFRMTGADRQDRASRSASPPGQVVLAWPVEREMPAGWEVAGYCTEVGTLPERRELGVRWSFEDPEGEGLHPATVALLEAIEAADEEFDLSHVRQVGLLDEEGNPIGVELVCTVAREAGPLGSR